MMNEKKNIDRLFQEKFKNFEVTPDEVVWEKIKNRQNQRKKRVLLLLPFKYSVAGVAALLAIIFTIGYFSRNTDPVEDIVVEDITIPTTEENASPTNDVKKSNQEEIIVTSNKKEVEKPTSGDHNDQNQTNHNNITTVPKIFDNIQKATVETSNKAPESVVDKTQKTRNQETVIANNSIKQEGKPNNSINQKKNDVIISNAAIDKKIATQQNPEGEEQEKKNKFLEQPIQTNKEKHSGVAKNNATNDQNSKNVEETSENINSSEDSNKKSIFDAINQEEEAVAEQEKTNKKWNVSPNVAPVYYNSFGSGSSIDAQFADNSKNGQVNLSYGIQVAYNLNQRLSIRSGVSKVDLSYSTQDIGFSPSSLVSQNLQSIDYNSNAEAILVSDIGSNENGLAVSDINRDAIQSQNEGLLNQRIGYIEVPLEMKYALVNKKLGVNMIGGVSTLFLQDNEVSVEAGDFETTIGEANNLNEVSFTGNIGIGIDYKLSDQFQVNLEPIFKYQFNGFSGNTENFRPYYFGVYTGVSIKF